jgi:hypothetical protein
MHSSLGVLLSSSWAIDGGPPVAPPFAFVNGILQPLVLSLQTGPVSMGLMALALLLILFPARSRRWAWVVFVALLAFWALAAEAGFALFGLGTASACIVLLIWRRRGASLRPVLALLAVVVLAAVLAAAQGGTLTEAARRLLPWDTAGWTGSTLGGFSLRDAPAIVSSHLGELRLSNPGEVVIGLAELGAPLLFAPLAAWVLARSTRRSRAFILAFGISTFIGFVLPIFVRYEVDRDITRLTSYSLIGWVLLAVIPLQHAWSRGGSLVRWAIALTTVAVILPGVIVAGSLLTAVHRAVVTEGFTPADTSMARQVWDRLAPGALVVDSSSWRAVAVTGRLTRSAQDSSTLLPEWENLVREAAVGRLVAAGFDYAYVDRTWWDNMDEAGRRSFKDPCVQEVAAVHDNGANGDRWLFDLRACPPG